MTTGVRLFKIDPSNRRADAVTEIDFAEVGFRERTDIQEWIADNPSILGEELLIVAKEFSGFDRTNERADLVAIDKDGKVVVIELKRDDTGSDVHWQAIKYASYFQSASSDSIVRMLSEYTKISEPEAETALKTYLDVDDLDLLNHDQRIILVSHRFAQEVTSAVIWLNKKTASEALITCVQITPYRDIETDAFFIQSSTILPIAGTDKFTIRPGLGRPAPGRATSGGPVKKEDDITRILRGAALAALDGLPEELTPDKKSRWAGDAENHRYFHVWFTKSPWSNWGMSFQFMLFPGTDVADTEIITCFKCEKDFLMNTTGLSQEDISRVRSILEDSDIFPSQEIKEDNKWLELKITTRGNPEDQELQTSLSGNLRTLIEVITPQIKDMVSDMNQQ